MGLVFFFKPPHRRTRRANGRWESSPSVIKSYTAYDGTPAIGNITNGFVGYMDLSQPQKFNRSYDWVMSISVGEFIPRAYQDVYVANVVNPVKEGLVLSWGYKLNPGELAPNEKPPAEVMAMVMSHGFALDKDATVTLRSLKTFPWYRRGFLVLTPKNVGDRTHQNKAQDRQTASKSEL
jgi:hypothetical protein